MSQSARNSRSNVNRPVHTIRFGVIKAAIWANQTSNGVMHNVTLARSYKDGEEWRESQSLGPDDLLPASKALDQAHTWIFEQRHKGSAERPAERPPAERSAEHPVEQ